MSRPFDEVPQERLDEIERIASLAPVEQREEIRRRLLSENIYVILIPSDEGGYTATIPKMPGCISEGETIPESLRNLAEAAELWLSEASTNGKHSRYIARQGELFAESGWIVFRIDGFYATFGTAPEAKSACDRLNIGAAKPDDFQWKSDPRT